MGHDNKYFPVDPTNMYRAGRSLRHAESRVEADARLALLITMAALQHQCSVVHFFSLLSLLFMLPGFIGSSDGGRGTPGAAGREERFILDLETVSKENRTASLQALQQDDYICWLSPLATLIAVCIKVMGV